MRDRETSVFLCEPETFSLFRLRDRDFKVFSVRARDIQTLKSEPQIWLRAMRMNQNELVQKAYKGAFCCKPLYETSDLKICQQSINSIIFLVMT